MKDWDSIASFLGYEHEYDMLYDLYIIQGLSAQKIADKLECGQPTLVRRLRIKQIPRRKRGGAQGSQKEWTRLHLMDQRIVFFNSMALVASMMKVSVSCVYKYRRGWKNALLPDTTERPTSEVLKQT